MAVLRHNRIVRSKSSGVISVKIYDLGSTVGSRPIGAVDVEFLYVKYAAIPDIGLRELLAPNLTFSPIARGRHCGVEFEDYCTR